MGTRIATVAAVALAAAGVALALVFGGKKTPESAKAEEGVPGTPAVEIISPRNGARQTSHAAVVKVEVESFQLAPLRFGGEPQLGEGHLRFSLKRVPDCVDPKKLEDAISSPVGKGRLVGRSFDYAGYAGPNGVLAERIGSAGTYSPATRPEIYYHGLPPASTAWSSTSPRTAACRPRSTTSPTSRSSPATTRARNPAARAKFPAPRPLSAWNS